MMGKIGGNQMTDASKILPDKITSHLHPYFFIETNKHLKTDALQRAYGEGYNRAIDDMASTYGKEWVGVPDKESLKNELCQINFEGKPEWLLFVNKEIVNSKHKSLEDMLELLAESILKGLRGK